MLSGIYFVHNLLILLMISLGHCMDFQHQAPRFKQEPQSRVDFSNSSGTVIPCSASGQPAPIIRWVKHDGEILQDVPGLRYTRHDGSLVLSPFSGENYRADVHASIYRCEASNKFGVIGSRDVHVRAVVLQHYEIRLFDEFVLKGNMGVLRCPIPSFASDYVRVTSWERIDGFLITPGIISAKYGMLESGDLYIRDTTEHDGSYSFRCHTEDFITKEKKVSTNYSKIIVTEPRHNQPPRIARRLSRVSVPVGHRATLPCIAQGYPIPTYRWHRAQADQRPLPDHTISVSQEGGILIFHKVVPSDTGHYACHVTNVMGEDKVEFELIVEEPYRVVIAPSELRSEVGKTATFNCSVFGSPPGIVSWRKDMLRLFPGPRVIFPNPHLLQLRQIRRQDEGIYQCFVHRELTSSQTSAILTIGDLSPVLKLTFPEKTVQPGRYVSLTCIASGHPEPQIKWILDGIWPLSTRHGVLISSYQSSNGDVVSSVNFTSVDVADSGVYSCEASNDAGTESYSKRLNVFGQVFIRSINNLTATSGEPFYAVCPFGGYPYESITWKKDDRVLPINQRQRVFPNGTLLISETQPGIDDGTYSCGVTGTGQEIPVSRSFRIVIRTKPKVSKFSFQDNLHEGMRTAVTCIVVAGDGPLSTRWMKDGSPLDERSLDATVIPAEEGFVSTITIKSLSHKHNGNYTCLATNDVGTGSYTAVLIVKIPPKWILQPSDTHAVAGRSAKIDCQADGVPQPHVRWKVATDHPSDSFKTVVSSSHVHILVNGSLNFRNVEPTDSGYYLCEASNGVGVGLSTVVRLTVHSAPQFQSKFMVLSVRKGEKFVIECTVSGDRPMRFIWRKNSELIDPSLEERYSETIEEMIDQNVKATLTVEKAERKDSSLFMCTAVNDFGDDTMNVQVTIKDLPDAPQNLEVHDVSSRSLRLTWDRPFDGNSPITQYTVMWRQADDKSSGGPLKVHGNERSVTVRGLRPKTRYFFRVKCMNPIGESQYGAEVAVTTLEEPPRSAPQFVKAMATSSKSLNVSWQVLSNEESESNIVGFYVGYKLSSSADAFTFVPVDISRNSQEHFHELTNLNRHSEYSIIVQSFNKRGAGPPSESASARTLEFDRPLPPTITSYYTTYNSIKINWEHRSLPNAPVTGFVLYYKADGADWQETHILGKKTLYTLHDLLCGTKYYCFLVATNSAGKGNSSETISTKTTGSAPLAPDKRLLITVNTSTITINLNSWHNGGCPIRFYVIQYKVSGHNEWTLVSNNIVPEQQTVTITDLIPGTWYSLLMTSRNDAGSTDAEYVFATLTLTGEYPPRPSEMSDATGSFYRHLTITVPVVSSVIVLILVICVVCVVTKRRTPGCRPHTPEGADGCDTLKQDSIPLSGTYDARHETYFPAPYATSRVQNFNSDHCLVVNNSNQQNTCTFGSTRSGYTYNMPIRKAEKEECIYTTPTIYLSTYEHAELELRTHRELAIYEVPDRGRFIMDGEKLWRGSGDGNSSTESDNDDLIFSLHSADDVILREEARESETECDRLWKTYDVSRCKEMGRWKEGVLAPS